MNVLCYGFIEKFLEILQQICNYVHPTVSVHGIADICSDWIMWIIIHFKRFIYKLINSSIKQWALCSKVYICRNKAPLPHWKKQGLLILNVISRYFLCRIYPQSTHVSNPCKLSIPWPLTSPPMHCITDINFESLPSPGALDLHEKILLSSSSPPKNEKKLLSVFTLLLVQILQCVRSAL